MFGYGWDFRDEWDMIRRLYNWCYMSRCKVQYPLTATIRPSNPILSKLSLRALRVRSPCPPYPLRLSRVTCLLLRVAAAVSENLT